MNSVYVRADSSDERMYLTLINEVRKKEHHYYEAKEIHDNDVMCYKKPWTEVTDISPDGIPLIKEFSGTRDSLFAKRFRHTRNQLVGNKEFETEFIRNIREYLKEPELLAFIMPSGYFVFKNYKGELLNSVAMRVIENDKELKSYFERVSELPEIFLINKISAIGVSNGVAFVGSEDTEYKNARIEMWIYIMLHTNFFANINGVRVIE